MSGNFAQIMADITPEALAQLMQHMPPSGQMSLTSMPAINRYDIEALGPAGEAHVYNVTFHSEMGKATLGSEWKQILGQWKISGVTLMSLEPAPPVVEG